VNPPDLQVVSSHSGLHASQLLAREHAHATAATREDELGNKASSKVTRVATSALLDKRARYYACFTGISRWPRRRCRCARC